MKNGSSLTKVKAQLRNALPATKQAGRLRGAQRAKCTIHKQAETYQAGIAAMAGIGNKALERITGLRPHQVSYRLVHTGASQARRNLREGKGPVAEFLLGNTARKFLEREFVDIMREKLGLQT